MSNQNKFDLILGFTASVLSGYVTGGTQVGRKFSANERKALKENCDKIASEGKHKNFPELIEAFNAFEEVIGLFMTYNKEDFDRDKVSSLLVLISVQSLAAIRCLEADFSKYLHPVDCFILAAKLVTFSFFIKDKRIGYGLPAEINAKLPENVKIEEGEHLKQEISELRNNACIDICMRSRAMTDALQTMNCVRVAPLVVHRPSSLVGFGIGRSTKSKKNMSKDFPLPDTTSFTMKFRKKKKNKPGSESEFFSDSLNNARKMVREVFMLSMILSKFKVEAPVVYNRREIDPKSVPQVFQTCYISKCSSSKKSPISFDTYRNFSVVLYDNAYFEVFDNLTQVSLFSKKVESVINPSHIKIYDDYVVVATYSRIFLYDMTSPTFDEVVMFSFRGNEKEITSIMCMAGFLYVGLDDGSIAIWSVEANKEVATCKLQSKNQDEELSLFEPYETPVLHITGDRFTQRMVSIADDNKICFWKGVPKNQLLDISKTVDSQHWKVTAISSNDGEIFTGGIDGNIRIWDLSAKIPVLVVHLKRAHFGLQNLGFNSRSSAKRKERTKKKPPKLKKQKRSSSVGSSFEPGIVERQPFAITSIAVHNDLLISSAMDRTIKIWDLSKLSKIDPIVINKFAIIEKLKVFGRNLYVLGDRFDKYEIDGVAIEDSSNYEPKLGSKDLSFNFSAQSSGRNFNRDGPELIMHVQKQKSVASSGSNIDIKDISLEMALKSRRIRRDFMKFLRESFADENLEFYIVSRRFEKFYDSFPEKTRNRESRKIIHRFIEVGANKEINISAAERQKLLQEVTVTKTMFRKAVKQVYILMNSNFFLNFKRSFAESSNAEKHNEEY